MPHYVASLAVDSGDLALLRGNDDHLADAKVVAQAAVSRHRGDQRFDVSYFEEMFDRRVELN